MGYNFLDKRIHISSLDSLTKAIDIFVSTSRSLKITMRHRTSGPTSIECALFRNNKIIFKENFKGKYMHLRLAAMYDTILKFVVEIERIEAEKSLIAKKNAEYKELMERLEREEKERIERMPYWNKQSQ